MGIIVPIILAVVDAAFAGYSKVRGQSAQELDVDAYELVDRERARAERCVRHYDEGLRDERQDLYGRLDRIYESMLNGHVGEIEDLGAARAAFDAMNPEEALPLTEDQLSVLWDYAALAAKYSIDMDESTEGLAGLYGDSDDYVAAVGVVVTLSAFGRLLEDVPGQTALKEDAAAMVDEVVPALLDGTITVRAEDCGLRTGYFYGGEIFINKIDSRSRIMSSFNIIVHESRHVLQHLRGEDRRLIDMEEEAGRVQFAAIGLLNDLHRRRSPMEVEAHLEDYVNFGTSSLRHTLAAAKCMGLDGPTALRFEEMIEEIAFDARDADGELYSELVGEGVDDGFMRDYAWAVLLAKPDPYGGVDGAFGFIDGVPDCSQESMDEIASTGLERSRESLERAAAAMRSDPDSLELATEFADEFEWLASCAFYLDKGEWNEMLAENMDDLIFAREVLLGSRVKL